MGAVHIWIIGGSGLSQPGALEAERAITVARLFGEPSAHPTAGGLPVRFTFLACDVCGASPHAFAGGMPRQYRCAQALRCPDVLAIPAVGSLRQQLAPGEFVAADRFIDRTPGSRDRSFLRLGRVAQRPATDAVCPRRSRLSPDGVVRPAGACTASTATCASVVRNSRPAALRADRNGHGPELLARSRRHDCEQDPRGAPRPCRSGTRQPARARRLVATKWRAEPARTPLDTGILSSFRRGTGSMPRRSAPSLHGCVG